MRRAMALALVTALVWFGAAVQTAHAAGCPVLIINDGGSGTGDLAAALTAAGSAVTVTTVNEDAYDGTNPAPGAFGAVIHLDGVTYFTDMPAAGQTALADFVTDGGGYISNEWLAFEVLTFDYYQNIRDLILFDRVSGAENPVTMSVVPAQSSHPVLAGVPASFPLSAGYNIGPVHAFGANPATVLMTDSLGSDALAVRDVGDGRVVGFHNGGNYGNYGTFNNPAVQLLYSNAVSWACADLTPPSVAITTADPSILLGPPVGSDTVDGTATDDASGVDTVSVTFTGILVSATVAATSVTCTDASRTSCTWSAPVPGIPDVYTVTASAKDRRGNASGASGSITAIVV